MNPLDLRRARNVSRKGWNLLRALCLAVGLLFSSPSPPAHAHRFFAAEALLRPLSFDRSSGAVQVGSRPRMILISRLGIYYAPDLPYNLFLLNRVWFYYYAEKWYQSRSYDGPWRYVPFSNVPEKLKNLPEEFMKKGNVILPQKAKPSKKKSSKKKPANGSK